MVQLMALDGMVMLPSGAHFSLIDPDPAQIDIKDIASTLAKMCRFGARCGRFYSVAEHSFRCAFVGHMDGLPKEARFALLMHDAAEAYTGDVASPLKRMIGELYGPIEARVAAAVSRRFEIDFDKWTDEIHEIDKAVVLAERKALYPDYPEKWPNEDGVRVLDLRFDFCDFAEAENLLIRYFNLLKPKCVE